MTTYAKQYYLELIAQQILANSKDADELMVQRLYDVPDIAMILLEFMLACGQPLKRDAYARGLALATRGLSYQSPSTSRMWTVRSSVDRYWRACPSEMYG